MKVCVVTATFDRRFILARRQLLSLAMQEYRDFVVVVVDDASESQDIENLCESRRWNFPILYRRIDGLGIDIGLSYRFGCSQVPSDCDLVVVLHGEILLSPNALGEFVNLLDRQGNPPDYALQAIPENLLDNSALTDEILLTDFKRIDTVTLASIEEHGDLLETHWGHMTWERDPFPRYWYRHYDPMRNALTRPDGTACGYTWKDLKKAQYAKNPEPLVFAGQDRGLWSICCAFRVGSVPDIKNAWTSGHNGVWGHEQWNGFRSPVTVMFPTNVTVIHQCHFSEPTIVSRWPHLGAQGGRNLPKGMYKQAQFRSQLETDRLGFYY